VALHRKSLQALTGKLNALSPLAILERGYSICSRLPGGEVVKSVAEVEVGGVLKVLFKDGEAVSEVKEKRVLFSQKYFTIYSTYSTQHHLTDLGERRKCK